MRLPFGGGAAADPGVVQDHLEALGGSDSLRGALRNHPVIGYAAPEPVDTAHGNIAEMRYYLAQFALAPTLIAPQPGYPLVLANFWRPEQLERFIEEQRASTLVRIDSKSALVAMRED